MISIKDYAKDNGITYEAVRQQVKRYQNELEGHIHQEGRTQFLDDIAVEILNEHRAKNPIAIYDSSKDEMIEQLKQEKENLLIKIAAQADQIAELALWKSEKSLLLAEANQQQLLLEEKSNQISLLTSNLEEIKANIKELEDKLHLEQQKSEQLNSKLQEESNRQLSFYERLTGHKKNR